MNGHGGRERQLFELERLAKAGLTQPLGLMQRGGVGRILAVQSGEGDVERGLLEMGFVEGACVEVLHHGLLGRDPLAVRINQSMTVALRRGEANAVLVGPLLDQRTGAESIANQEGGAIMTAGILAAEDFRPVSIALGRPAQQRQDHPVQHPDRRPAKDRQLPRRDCRAQKRPVARHRSATRSRFSTCPAVTACAPAVPTKPSPAMSCWAGRRGKPCRTPWSA